MKKKIEDAHAVVVSSFASMFKNRLLCKNTNSRARLIIGYNECNSSGAVAEENGVLVGSITRGELETLLLKAATWDSKPVMDLLDIDGSVDRVMTSF